MKDVEESWTGGQVELVAEAVDTAHGQEHGNGRAKGKEVTRSEHELWIVDHRHSCASSTDDEIHRRIGRRPQQWITDRTHTD